MLFKKCRKTLLPLLITLCAMFSVAAFLVAQDTPNDDLAQIFTTDIVSPLLKGEKNLTEWADELERTPPKAPQEIWVTYLVCLRAERDEAVCKMIPLLFDIINSMQPRFRSNPSRQVFLPLTKLPPKRWKVVATFCETFDTIYCPVEAFPLDFLKLTGWTNEEIAQWLEKRFQNAYNTEPDEWERNIFFFAVPGTLSRATWEWQRLYLFHLEKMGKVQTELERLNSEAKESPFDAKKWNILSSAFTNRPRYYEEIQLDLDWLIPTTEKREAFNVWSIATSLDRVTGSNVPKIREVLLDRALAEPLSEAGCQQFRKVLQSRSSMVQPQRSDALIRAMFRVEVMDGLNRLYLSEDRSDEAQKIMLEARELRKEHHLPEGSLLAGMTQGASGQRIVEEEILEREVVDESKPAYWMERAAYYQGRKESQEEEKALRRALALLDTPESRKTGASTSYRQVCYSLFRFLLREERLQDAAILFRECRTQVQNEPVALLGLHYDYSDVVKRLKNRNEYEKMLVEDVKAALDWFRKNPKPASQDTDYINEYYLHRDFASNYYELVVRECLLDFENDPFAWEYLNQSAWKESVIKLLLFPPVRNDSLHESMLKAFEKALKDDKLTPQLLYSVGVTLCGNNDFEIAVKFLEEALRRENADNSQGRDLDLRRKILANLATCSLELDDWRKGETYSVDYFLCPPTNHHYEEQNLRANLNRAADLAEKAGETNEAERIRQRIANLGN